MSVIYETAVLLTCYNRCEKTLKCLHSLFDISLPVNFKIEVFLTDDGSTDGTGEAIKSQYPMVNIIQGNGNLFWNRGMNLAWKAAVKMSNYDFYLWLNDDVILNKDSIKNLMKDRFELDTDNFIIVGACCSANNTVSYSGYNSLKKKMKICPNGEIQECNYFNGNVVLIPSSVFDRIGFLNPVFQHGLGDFDYGLRAKEIGVKSFLSSSYVGTCELNDKLPIWCNPNFSFSDRLKNFNSPLGGRPFLNFLFERRHRGYIAAIFHYFTIYLRLIFPIIWGRT